MSNDKLKELFPDHADEIDEISSRLACGCSGCVWNVLKKKYSLELPVEYRYPYIEMAWG